MPPNLRDARHHPLMLAIAVTAIGLVIVMLAGVWALIALIALAIGATFIVARAGVAPVLLIHGYVNNAGALWRRWRTLVESGVGVHTLNLEPVYTSIDNYAPLIANRIAAIRALTGTVEVTLVGHSMGGLAARADLREIRPDDGTLFFSALARMMAYTHGSRQA